MKRNLWLALALMMLLVAPLAVSAQSSPVHLVLWHAKQDQEGDGLLALIDAFQTAHPDITVEQVYNPSGTLQDSFTAAAGSGGGPDMVIWANDSVGPFATAHLIADISGSVDDTLKAQATDSAWGTFSFNGGIWGVPFSAKTLAFFYNKSLVPDAPATWADVLKTAKDLHTSQGVVGLAFQNGFFHSAGFLYALGGSLMDDNGNAAFGPDNAAGRAAMVAYLQFHHDMYQLSQDANSGVIVDGSSPNPQFQTGDVAMIYDGVWNLAQYEKDLGSDLGVAVMPKLDNGNIPALFAQTEGFYANANLANDPAKMAAFIEWGKFVTSVDGQTIASQKAGLLPVNPNVTVADPNQQTFPEQFAHGTPFPNRAELGAFWGPMGDAITAVSAGGITPEAETDAAYTAIQTAIDGIHNPVAPTPEATTAG